MGFRNGSYATVWDVDPKFDTLTKVRISVNRKNKQTGEYEQDFSGFVDFVGTAAAHSAAGLKEKDRIKLGEVDVTSTYNKEKKTTYVNYKVFSFEMADKESSSGTSTEESKNIDDGEAPDLPF